MDAGITMDGRGGRERRRRASFVLLERRSGFDRRGSAHGRGARMLLELRDSPAALIVLLATVNVMNLIDHLATARALAAGFSEGNPVMASLIATDPRLAAAVKLGVVALVTAGVWGMRRYRVILEASLVMVAVLAAVLVVHFLGAALYL